MEDGSAQSRYGGLGGARKLLQGKSFVDQTPVTIASPASPTQVCRDVKSGIVVSCQNPHTLVIIIAGMSCMMVLIIVAVILLCCSVVRQRQHQRTEQNGRTDAATGQITPPVDSPEYDDAVLVQLPGNEKPQCVAFPKPFVADVEKEIEKVVAVTDDGLYGEKDISEALSADIELAGNTAPEHQSS